MNAHTLTVVLFFPLALQAQDKKQFVRYDKLIEVQGSAYVIATAQNTGKTGITHAYMQFVNTMTGDTREIDMPEGARIGYVQQVKMDSLGINRIIVTGQTVNLDGNKAIDWNDPHQLIVLSTDGQEQVRVTDDNYFTGTWMVDQQTGKLVITGHRDVNDNGKLDYGDKNEIIVFDMKLMKRVGKGQIGH